MPKTLAVDAMGGDRAPEEVVRGTLAFARECPERRCILVGDEARLRPLMAGAGANLRVVHCTQFVDMHENAVEGVRGKRDASIRRAMELVKRGEAQAVFSAGHTGAAVAAATLTLRQSAGIKRAGLAAAIPSLSGHTVLIDVGANIHCKALHLYHYGVMGSHFARVVLGLEHPRVGLLSIGEEQHKGTDLVRETHAFFKDSPLAFVGNVEGIDIFNGRADVVVCDGFAGNLVLKTAEGVGESVITLIKQMAMEAAAAGTLNLEALMPLFAGLRQRLDYSEYGGAPLLGVNGLVVIGHGRSDAKAIASGLRMTATMADGDLTVRIAESIARYGHVSADPRVEAATRPSDS